MLDPHDTIAALASAPGGAARAVVRVSGPQTVTCVELCFTADGGEALSQIRRPTAIPGSVRLADVAAPLPCTLYLWPSARSYTRQPTAEVHTVASPPLVDALLAELCAKGARLARPGEFTLRAFLAGRIDLTQAEAVLGVIDARGRRELETALSQLAGGLAAPLARLRGELLDALAHLEAGLDFVEEDIEFISPDDLDAQLAAAQAEVEGLLDQMQARGEAPGTLRAVLIGAPNVGKSSLYNALGGQNVLVSEQAGTTRDYLATRLDLDGTMFELVDTAGIEHAQTTAIARAAQAAGCGQREQAEIEIVCLDASRPLTESEEDLLASRPRGERLVVCTKTDLPRRARELPEAIDTSSRSGAGLDLLRRRLREAGEADKVTLGVVAATAVRCSESLRQAAEGLVRARGVVQSAGGEELVAAELRGTLHQLGEVAGEVYTDDILDRIFSRFCIGK
ncbi:MAG TPA: GTPase [Pirellulales bacterium]|nr:GTPase [Pirellulales bacterium]